MALTKKLTNREILKLHEGLVALDGLPDGTGKIERYDLDDKVSWNAAKCRSIVERAVELFNQERKKRGAKFGVVEGMKVTPENAESVAKYMDSVEQLQDATNDLTGLLTFKLADLQKGGVKTPGVLSNLMVLIEP